MNAVSSVISIYIGIFVNLYIWEPAHSIEEVSFFNLVMFLVWGLAFTLGAKLLVRFTIRLLVGLAAAGGGAAFAYLMTVQLDNRLLWIALLGVAVGGMSGFSSAAQNLPIALIGKGPEFAPYFAAQSLIAQVLSIAVPMASAKVIDAFGYRGSFALMLVFLGVMLFYAFRIPRITLPAPVGPEQTAHFGTFSFRLAFGYPGAKWVLCSLLAAGLFLQFQNLFGLLFTFSVTQDRLLIALLNALYTAAALLGLWLYRRYVLGESRWLWIGTVLIAAALLIVIIPLPAMRIASNTLSALGMFYFLTVWNSQQFRMIQECNSVQVTSFLVWREGVLVLTRCIMLSCTLFLDALHGAGFISLIGLTLLSLLAIPYFQSRAVRIYEKR
ncbi:MULTISPECIES: MFS transporter [Paenibacillus]|uniref:MFS transporter n=1 Tax=Paenibacillus TaxID=44249 RepID=UPI0022B918D6|nr:MFS transporter [Paenibacillus caseinilyticus]MCZ8519823.1 MFS transporter [Paenibacillus caseinilyticus]